MVVAVGPSHMPGKSVIWPSEEGKLRLGKVGVGTQGILGPQEGSFCPAPCRC